MGKVYFGKGSRGGQKKSEPFKEPVHQNERTNRGSQKKNQTQRSNLLTGNTLISTSGAMQILVPG